MKKIIQILKKMINILKKFKKPMNKILNNKYYQMITIKK